MTESNGRQVGTGQKELFGGDEQLRFKNALEHYGQWPMTVWEVNLSDALTKQLKNWIGDDGSARDTGKGAAGYKHKGKDGGISIFNPAVAAWIFNMYAPKDGGLCFDPFAGGGTRAAMAAAAGLDYLGVELRQQEVDACMARFRRLGLTVSYPGLTPVEHLPELGIWAKRDDLYVVGGARGAKARSCWSIASRERPRGIVTAASTRSTQLEVVTAVAGKLGVPLRVHVPANKERTPEMLAAEKGGAELVEHRPGWLSVIEKRARDDAEQRGWLLVPFGIECEDSVEMVRRQVQNLPWGKFDRIAITAGSGMCLSGLLWGLVDCRRTDVPVMAVSIGAEPDKRLDQYAPPWWREMVTMVHHPAAYKQPAEDVEICGIPLDPYYEAKVAGYLEPGDLFWIVGCRQSRMPAPGPVVALHTGDSTRELPMATASADFLLTCPPYYDLEVYDGGPRDLSTLPTYEEFVARLRVTVEESRRILKPGATACWVVGLHRRPDSELLTMHHDIARLHQQAGYKLREEVILSMKNQGAIQRVGNFDKGNKLLIRTHEYVMVFTRT